MVSYFNIWFETDFFPSNWVDGFAPVLKVNVGEDGEEEEEAADYYCCDGGGADMGVIGGGEVAGCDVESVHF